MCQSISSYRSLFFCALLSTCIGAADFVLAAFHLCAPPLPGAIPLPPRTPPLKKRPLPYIGRNVLEVSTLRMNKNISVESILITDTEFLVYLGGLICEVILTYQLEGALIFFVVIGILSSSSTNLCIIFVHMAAILVSISSPI